MRARRARSIVVLSVGALGAWVLDLRSSGAPGPEDMRSEIAPIEDMRPLLRTHPGVTRRERPRPADADAEPASAADAAVAVATTHPSEAAARDETLPVEVLVLDMDGDPVAGTDVEVPRHRARTDAAGRARLPPWGFDMGMPSQDRYWKTVIVRAPGYVPVAHVGGGRREVVRLESRGGRLSGACEDADGRPVAGLCVALVWHQGRTSLECLATTTPDGRFDFDHAPPAWARLEVRDPAWRAPPGPVVPPQDDVRIVVRPSEEVPWSGPVAWPPDAPREPDDPAPPPLPRPPPSSTAPLRVRLVDPRGRPVEDGTVFVRWADAPSILEATSRADGPEHDPDAGAARVAGEHVVPCVPPGTFELVWRSGTHGRSMLLRGAIGMSEPAAPLDLGDVALPTPVLVDVLVEDTAGPVPGAVVRWRSADDVFLARTDRDGRCRVPVADPAHGVVEAWHPERGTGRSVPGPAVLAGRVRLFIEPPSPRSANRAESASRGQR